MGRISAADGGTGSVFVIVRFFFTGANECVGQGRSSRSVFQQEAATANGSLKNTSLL